MSKRSFGSSLVSILFWFFVLVLIAAFLMPTFSCGPVIASKAAAGNNLSQIAKTYLTYSTATTPPRTIQLPPGSTVHDAAFLLAKFAQFNDAALWVIPSDDALAGVAIPRSVIEGNPATATAPSPAFARVPLSVVFAANIATSAPSTTTPVAWTRGLRPDGHWSKNSPFHGSGGHIAFLDGHVEWFDQLDVSDPQSSLIIAPGWPHAGHATANITQALPPGAVILSPDPHPATK